MATELKSILNLPQVIRKIRLAEKVVFVGGLGGCGKTMLTPIIGSFDRVEIQKYDYTIEHVCTLHYLGKISDDVASTMIRLQVDLDLYNMMMSRETNFRWKDLSSVFTNPGKWRYIWRLFLNGDENVIPRIEKEKPILNITMHDLVQRIPTLWMALEERASFIVMVRHPLYMIKQWMVNAEQFFGREVNPRDFNIHYQYGAYSLNWFVHGWEEKYLGTNNNMDRVIYLLESHIKNCNRVMVSLSESQRGGVLLIPFEIFVLNPYPYLDQVQTLLGSKTTPLTYKELKKQSVPRKMIADGIGIPVYKKYGWEPSNSNDEREEFNQRREFARRYASKEGMDILDRLCTEYETNYLS